MQSKTTDEKHQFSMTEDFTAYYVEARFPTEPALIEVRSRQPISFQYSYRGLERDEARWVFVFKLWDFSEMSRVDGGGIHAVLSSIYSYDDNDDLQTVAINGGTTVPEGVREIVLDRDEVDGFGRPPYIPERDGDA